MSIDSAYKALRAALTSTLTRGAVFVGSTSGYPRVEIHSITENERTDKAGNVRRLTATIETITTDSLVHAHELNAENLALLENLQQAGVGLFTIIGIVPDQLQDLTETADAQNTLYRIMQTVECWVERAELHPIKPPLKN